MPTARKIVEAHGKEKHGHVIAQYLLESTDPEQAYAITPVTTEKYKICDITSDVENNVFINGRTTKVIKNLSQSDARRDLNGKKKRRAAPYHIGTVSSLKGTEKDRVVVYGVSRSYSPKVKTDLFIRRVYVAISRARENLHVVTNPYLREDNPLKQLFEPSASCKSRYEWQLTVKELAKEKCTFWPSKHGFVDYDGCDKMKGLSKSSVAIPAISGDEDFVGRYIERVLAYCLGFKDVSLPESLMNDENITAQFNKDRLRNPCFALVRAAKSMQDGSTYTASNRLLSSFDSHQQLCQPFATFIRGHMAGSCKYQQDLELPIRPHRSSKQVGVLRGRPDFTSESVVMEIKHVGSLSWDHYLQTAIYSSMFSSVAGTGFKEALLINLRDGSIRAVNGALSSDQVEELARAKLALNNTSCKKDSKAHNCYVAVAAIKDDDNQIVELGAVAFSLAGDVYGTYHRLLSGVSEVTSYEEQSCGHKSTDTYLNADFSLAQAGLRVDNQQLLQEQELESGLFRNHFHMWVNNMSRSRDFVYWDRSLRDELKLKINDSTTINLQEKIKENVASVLPAMSLDKVTLAECVMKRLGVDWIYEPHRAFEDAVAIAALFADISAGDLATRSPSTTTNTTLQTPHTLSGTGGSAGRGNAGASSTLHGAVLTGTTANTSQSRL
jgi:hypothetical protein